MDSSYARLRPVYDNQSDTWQRNMLKAIDDGIKQGVFRSDVNYPILLRMFRIQIATHCSRDNLSVSDAEAEDCETAVKGTISDKVAKRDFFRFMLYYE